MAQLTINVIESGGKDNGYLPGTATNVDGEIRATSVKDMVDQVLRKLGKDDCIKQLNLIGHGAPGDISVGAGQESIAGKQINGDESDWLDQVKRLKGKFCKGGELRLLGCNTGVCNNGAAKLHKLANLLGVTVKGTNQNLYPGDFGKDGYTGGDGKLVSVAPGLEQPPRCLTEGTTKGVKKKKKTDQLERQVSQIQQQVLQARACGFHNVRTVGLPDATDPVLRPFSGRVLEAFLALYDLTTPFEGFGLAAKLDVVVNVLYDDNASETWELVLDFNGLIIRRFGAHFLFLSSHDDPGAVVREYLALQECQERFYRNVLGLDARGFNLRTGRFALSFDSVQPLLDKRARTLSPEELLQQPLDVFNGVSSNTLATMNRVLDVRTVADLANLGAPSPFTKVAQVIQLLAEEDARARSATEGSEDY